MASALLLLSAQRAQSAAGEEFPAPGSFPFHLPCTLREADWGGGKLLGKREMEKEKLLVDGFHFYTGNVKTGEADLGNRERVKSS